SIFFRRTRGLMGWSRSGDTLISLKGLASLMNSSNSITIFSASKFRVKFGGVSLSMVGGMESLGPPWGCWILAHCQVSEKRAAKNRRIIHFGFEAVFRRFEQLLFFDMSCIG